MFEVNTKSEEDFEVTTYAKAYDNSNKVILSYDLSKVDFGRVGNYDVVITAEDYSGNKTEEVVTFVVVDTKAPVIEVINENMVFEICTREAYDFNIGDFVKITDNGEVESVTWDIDTVDFDKVGLYPIVITAKDTAGNETSVTVNMELVDLTPPVLTIIKDTELVEVSEDYPLSSKDFNINDFAKAEDNSGDCRLEWDLDILVDFMKVGTYPVDIYAVDASGNQTVKSIKFIVRDTTPPVIEILNKVEEVEVNEASAKEYKIFAFAKAKDNSGECKLTWNIDTVKFNKVGTYHVDLKAVDPTGNTAKDFITFEVRDTKAPLINVIQRLNRVEINSMNARDLKLEDYVSAYDNSGNCKLSWDIEKVDFTKCGEYLVTVKAEDSSKNKTSIEFNVKVVDTIAPVITLLKKKIVAEVNVSNGSDFNIEEYVSVSDNSGRYNVKWDINTVDFTKIGVKTIEILAKDDSDNQSRKLIEVHVEDSIAPVIEVLKEEEIVEVNSRSFTNFRAKDFVNVTDNSGEYSVKWDLDKVDFNKLGTYVVTVTAKDLSGNKSTKELKFKVVDTTAPRMQLLKEIYHIEVNSKGNKLDVNDFVEVTDNYELKSVKWNFKDVVDTTKVGEYNVEIMATDTSNNTAVAYVLFKVVDTTAPVIKLLEDSITVEVASKLATDYKVSKYVEVTDNSDKYKLSWNISDVDFSTVGNYLVTITARDESNNSSSVDMYFRIVDTKAPVLTLLKEVEEIEIHTRTHEFMDINQYAIATDNSGDVSLTWNIAKVDFNKVGKYGVRVVARDSSGNETIRHIEFRVVDTIAPTLTIRKPIEDVEVNTKSAIDYDIDSYAFATDNSTDFKVEWNLAKAVKFNKVGSYNVKVTAIDSAGNSESKDITFNVVDTKAPVVTVKRLIEKVEINSAKMSDFKITDYVNVTDNSNEFTLEWDIDTVMFNVPGTYAVAVTAKDKSDNATSKVVKFMVQDTIPPYIKLKKEKVVCEIGAKNRNSFKVEDLATIKDNSNNFIADLDLSRVNFYEVGTYKASIVARDLSGNKSEEDIMFVIEDNEAPVINVFKRIQDVKIGSKNARDFNVEDYVSVTDNSGFYKVDWDLKQVVDFKQVGSYEVTIKAKDKSNNESKAFVTFVVKK